MRVVGLALLFDVAVAVPLVACGFPDVTFADNADAGTEGTAMDTAPNDPAATATPGVNEGTPKSDDADGEKSDAGPRTATDASVSTSVDAAAPAHPSGSTSSPPPTSTAVPTSTATAAPTATVAPVPTTTSPPPTTTTTPAPPPPAPTCNPNADFGTETKDYNCDGTITKEQPTNVSCKSLTDCTQGFSGDPACGAAGAYNICKKTIGLLGNVLCDVDHTEVRTQRCR